MMRRAVRMLTVVVSLVVAVVALTGGTASASPAGVQVGLTASGPFADQLPHSLFRGAGKLVPGDRVERTFYLRNGADVGTRASVRVLLDEAAPLAEVLDVRVGLGGAPMRRDSGKGVTDRLVLAPGDVREVQVSLAFDPNATGGQGMSERVSLDLLVTLTQAGSSTPDGDGDPDDGGHPDGGDPDGGVLGDPDGNPGDAPSCQEQAVVALDGTRGSAAAPPATDLPACVPTVVDSGTSDEGAGAIPYREPGSVASTALLAVLSGAILFLAASRRRRT